MILNNLKSNNGFTLVELMVATSLFIVIMISALGSLFVLIDESKNSRALRVSMENVNFAMDSMTRAIRMGTDYSCDGSLLGCVDGTRISFVPQSNTNEDTPSRVEYLFRDNKLLLTDDTHSEVSIVSPDVKIDDVKFNVRVPVSADSQIHPNVYITMKGTVMVNGVPTSFALQTLASQRNF